MQDIIASEEFLEDLKNMPDPKERPIVSIYKKWYETSMRQQLVLFSLFNLLL